MMVGLWGVASVVLVLLSVHGVQQLASADATTTTEDDVGIESGGSFHLPVKAMAVPESGEERREHFRALEAKDRLRHRYLSRRRQARESTSQPELLSDATGFELPMRSAINIVHVGVYLVSVRFGTPAQPFNLALDTANDLTWINCRLRRRRGKHYGRPRVAQSSSVVNTMSVDEEGEPVRVVKNWFRPALSSSWRRFRCSQPTCAWLPYNACESPNQTASCSYYHVTQDGTRTSGIYGQEKATVALSSGRYAKLPGLIVGCSTFEAGGSVDAHDGVLSMGNSNISFGCLAAARFSSRFSFCLLSTNSSRNDSSYLTFGPNPAVTEVPGTMETDLKYGVGHMAFEVEYGVQVTGVLVNDQLLDIPPEVWDVDLSGAGIILDTGSSITTLLPPAYDAVTAALDRHLAHLQRMDLVGFEFCYNWTFTGDGVDPANNVTIPTFTVEMLGGARLQPDAKSIVMPEVEPGVACLAFRKMPKGPGIFGNVIMQEHIWEFDHLNGKLRFRKDSCTNNPLNSPNPNSTS